MKGDTMEFLEVEELRTMTDELDDLVHEVRKWLREAKRRTSADRENTALLIAKGAALRATFKADELFKGIQAAQDARGEDGARVLPDMPGADAVRTEPCRHGHFDCAVVEGGQCFDEQYSRWLAERDAAATQ